jgi:hypothetical protein
VPDFEQAWTRADRIRGWLTRDQGRQLWDAATGVPTGGRILEIGSHEGRSTIVLAAAAEQRQARVVAVDPHLAGGMFGGAATREKFRTNVSDAGLADTVELIEEKSTDLRPRWDEPIDVLFIDGKHDYWTVRDDLRWADHLPAGAPVLIHDAFSSIGVTLGLLLHVLPSNRLRYVYRSGSLARFDVDHPTAADRLSLLAQLPWFVRNVGIKVILRIGRLFGRTHADPY